jgi:molybdopterin-guanine dinucleotide biosynthesis protein A
MGMDNQALSAAGFVLVGGQSRRMGRDKALLEFEGKPMFLRTAEIVRPQVKEFMLLGSSDSSQEKYFRFGIPLVEDLYPSMGPLGALCTGLKISSCDWNLFFACDLPHLTRAVVAMLVEQTCHTSAEAVVPQARDRWQPLCAAYHRSCLPVMDAAIHRGQNLSVIDLFPLLHVQVLVPDTTTDPQAWEQTFANMNTASEWEKIRRGEGQ